MDEGEFKVYDLDDGRYLRPHELRHVMAEGSPVLALWKATETPERVAEIVAMHEEDAPPPAWYIDKLKADMPEIADKIEECALAAGMVR